jgi:hypothetical protein
VSLLSVVPYLHAAEGENLLPVPSVVFPIVALASFLVLGLITWSYRDVANRHAGRRRSTAPHGPTH